MTNTTIGVIATTARLDSVGVNRLASIGHDGMAMAIRPSHTMYDGDTIFTGWRGPEWLESSREHHAADDKNVYAYSFITLERRSTSVN